MRWTVNLYFPLSLSNNSIGVSQSDKGGRN